MSSDLLSSGISEVSPSNVVAYVSLASRCRILVLSVTEWEIERNKIFDKLGDDLISGIFDLHCVLRK